MLHKTVIAALVISVTGIISACSHHPEQVQNQDLQEESNQLPSAAQPALSLRTNNEEHRQLRDAILAQAGQRQADSLSQCQLIEFGHNPCGGPQSYVVYSQKGLSADELAQFTRNVERFNQLDTLIKSSRQLVGACVVTEKPELRLENGRCMAGINLPQR